MLIAIPPAKLEAWWPSAAAALAPAVERTRGAQTLGTVLDSILAQDAYLWACVDGHELCSAHVTSVYRCPTGQRRLRFSLTGGHDLAEMAREIANIEDWARTNGAEAAEIVGRKGWGRVLEGYREMSSTFIKEL
jgi:hypothetical protein